MEHLAKDGIGACLRLDALNEYRTGAIEQVFDQPGGDHTKHTLCWPAPNYLKNAGPTLLCIFTDQLHHELIGSQIVRVRIIQ